MASDDGRHGLTRSGVVFVLRYRCAEDDAPKFLGELHAVLAKGVGPEVRVTVLQAMLSPDPTEWEVRVESRGLGSLGTWIEQQEADGGLLRRLTTVTKADLVSEGVPLYRRWVHSPGQLDAGR
jgi:hypothetical protein